MIAVFLLAAQQELHSDVSLIASVTTVQAGKPFLVGAQFFIEEGWHKYWINPGEAGQPSRVDWQLPAGWKVSEPVWPAPKRFESGGVVGFGYENAATLIYELTPPARLSGRSITLKANASWMVCNEQCLLGRKPLEIKLNIGRAAAPSKSSAALKQGWSAKPKPSPAEAVRTDAGIQLSVPVAGATKAEFFPAAHEMVAYAGLDKPTLTPNAIQWILKDSPDSTALVTKLTGLVVYQGRDGKTQQIWVDAAVTRK